MKNLNWHFICFWGTYLVALALGAYLFLGCSSSPNPTAPSKVPPVVSPPQVPSQPLVVVDPTPEPEPIPEPSSEPIPEPVPEPKPPSTPQASQCMDPQVNHILGCYTLTNAYADIQVQGQGDYRVFLMSRVITNHDIQSEASMSVGCNDTQDVVLNWQGEPIPPAIPDIEPVIWVVTVWVGQEQIVYDHLPQCQ